MAEKRKEGPRGTAAKKKMTRTKTPIKRGAEPKSYAKKSEGDSKKNPYRKSIPLGVTEGLNEIMSTAIANKKRK